MHYRLYAYAASLIVPLFCGGCVQMTRHSNMMIFGTNTVLGIRAGVNATSVPEVAIGYTRQEAVVLPLVANVASVPAKTTTVVTRNADGSTVTNTVIENGNANRLEPCNLGNAAPGAAPPEGYLVNPCSLVGINHGALDSYSVLASFGGNFKGSNSSNAPEASAGVAQYFATGIAAQTLALNGGAAVVASGTAATAAANKPALLATTEATPAEIAEADLFVKNYNAALAPLLDKIRASANLKREFEKFEAAIGSPKNIGDQCTTGSGCATIVKAEHPYQEAFGRNPDTFKKAVADWQTN